MTPVRARQSLFVELLYEGNVIPISFTCCSKPQDQASFNATSHDRIVDTVCNERGCGVSPKRNGQVTVTFHPVGDADGSYFAIRLQLSWLRVKRLLLKLLG